MVGRGLTRIVLAGLCVVGPAAARAQIGVGGIGGRGGIGGIGGMGGARAGRGGLPSVRGARDEPVINTVDLILRHFHDLALTDSQVTQLTHVKSRQDSLVTPIRARLDSLVHPHGRDEGGEIIDGADGDRLLARRDALKAYRAVFKQSRREAFAVLEKKQRKQAETLESDVRKELQGTGPGRGRGSPFGDPDGAGTEMPGSDF